MVDMSVMLGADEQAAESQMKAALDFEMKLAQVKASCFSLWPLNEWPESADTQVFLRLAALRAKAYLRCFVVEWTAELSVLFLCLDSDPFWEPDQWEHV